MNGFIFQLVKICQMIKVEHSIFALPYAWAGTFLAAGAMPPLSVLLFLTLAMICVRSFAMTFNRLADRKYDCQNPRTSMRALCTGDIKVWEAGLFCACMALAFIGFCALLNKLCFILSFPALLFVAIYSFLKRFTPLSHFWLGASLGLAPLAGALALGPNASLFAPLMLFFAVTFWVGAFDIYYAFQDVDFDQDFGLHSMPADYDAKIAMTIAGFSHILTVIFLILTGISANLTWPWYLVCAGIAILLYVEHMIVRPDDLSNINTAFFTLNGIISPVVFFGILLGIYFR